jgi:hypothetical protein
MAFYNADSHNLVCDNALQSPKKHSFFAGGSF